jgi:hypothetical protein
LEPLKDFKFMVSGEESFNAHDIVWSNAELAVVATYNAVSVLPKLRAGDRYNFIRNAYL